MLRRLVRFGVMLGLLVSSVPAPGVLAETPEVFESKIIITEVKLGGSTLEPEQPDEYVTLFNRSDELITLDGWLLEYAKDGFDADACDAVTWSGIADAGATVMLSGELLPGEVVSVQRQLTNDRDGSVRLSEANSGRVHDLVGWGPSAPCAEHEPFSTRPSTGKSQSILRYMDCDAGSPVDTNNNANDFYLAQTLADTAYGSLGNIVLPECEEDPEEPEEPEVPLLSCEGVVLSELLPNAAGSDAGREFIELYNPTDEVISLYGCVLQLKSSGKTFTFNTVELEPGEYLAFYDDVTKLTLPNASGDTIWLVTAAGDELEVAYPGNMEDDTAWALIDGVWQVTYAPTPSAANISMPLKPCAEGEERNMETGKCQKVTTSANTLTPCKEGQERNPTTNRCRAVASASTLTPCQPGQERNPETNRCRSVLSASSSLKPCDPGEERNPETNRCRKMSSTSLAPCKDGYERNPETNRCRKSVVAGDTIADVKDVESTPSGSRAGWYITGAVILAAVAFAIYEWRQEILQRLRSLQPK